MHQYMSQWIIFIEEEISSLSVDSLYYFGYLIQRKDFQGFICLLQTLPICIIFLEKKNNREEVIYDLGNNTLPKVNTGFIPNSFD